MISQIYIGDTCFDSGKPEGRASGADETEEELGE